MLWIILAAVIAVLAYVKIIRPHSYWKRLGVPQRESVSILGDNKNMVLRYSSFAEVIQEHYNAFPNKRFAGIYEFSQPLLLVRDPELIKQLTVKHFEHFTDHRQVFPEDAEPLWTRNLFALTGTRWKHMRATLSPSFTGSKMKLMYSLISDCAENFTDKVLRDAGKGEFEFKDLSTRFSNDVIATTAFGVQVDSYTDRTNNFYMMGKKVTDFTGVWQNIKMVCYIMAPKLGQLLGFSMFPPSAKSFFMELVTGTIKMREEKGIVRPDMIHLLMEARKGQIKEDDHVEGEAGFATAEESEIGKNDTEKREELTELDMCAQALIFFFAGFDSVATLMCFMAYELAVNPDIQDRLRQEIDDTMAECNGKLTYEAVVKMKYMDMVVSETLRKWPNGIAVDRRCTKPITIEPVNPDETPVHLDLNAVLWIPIFGIHRDPQYYPEPEKFDPERFNDENKHKINPYAYIPFGVGPRNCIGSRFALLEIKTLFFHILHKMEIVPNSKTPIPMKLARTSFQLNADPGFFFDLRPRKSSVENIK